MNVLYVLETKKYCKSPLMSLKSLEMTKSITRSYLFMLGILHILVLGQKSAIQTKQQTHYFFLSCKVKVKTFSQLEFDNIKEKQIDFKIRDEL